MTKAVVIGTSAGGIEALSVLLPSIPEDSVVPVFVVQHISPESDSFFIRQFNKKCKVRVKEACHTEIIKLGTVYFAPPDYHLLVESDMTLTLSSDEKVNFSRPSIDVLFETAADVYDRYLTGILLTGANCDGSKGLMRIKQLGGKTIVQDPLDAHISEMPESAIRLFRPDMILKLTEIKNLLADINNL